MMMRDVKEFISAYGAESFLKSFAFIYPKEAHELTSAILEDHAHDYDKKKAALLKNAH